MGRKIPKRKHMGIRDPIKQNEDRLALIKDKINNPPEKRDFQKVSHSLARFIKLKEAAKNASIQPKGTPLKKRNVGTEDKPENYQKKNKKPTNIKKTNDARNDKEFGTIKQRPNESDAGYMRRVNRITQDSVEEAKFEAKYGVEVVRNAKTGEIKLKKKPRNEIDERLKQNMENHKLVKKGGKAVKQVVIAPEERKKLAKAMLAEKKKKDKESVEPKIEEFKRDEFKFGEVVQAPPQLTVPRLAKKAETVPRPGKKSLLLHSVIDEYSNKEDTEEQIDTKSTKIAKNPRSNAIGTLKGKRKDLSMAMRNMIEAELENVVQLYKDLKKSQRLKEKTETKQKE